MIHNLPSYIQHSSNVINIFKDITCNVLYNQLTLDITALYSNILLNIGLKAFKHNLDFDLYMPEKMGAFLTRSI